MSAREVAGFELLAPVAPAAPVEVAPPPAPAEKLHGIDWAGIAAEARGEIALFDVQDPGELQAWGARGEVAR